MHTSIRSVLFKISLSILISYGSQFAFAQIDDLDIDMQEDVQCKPDEIVTGYEDFKIEDATQLKVAVWYSLAQEEYKYKNYKRALPYFWRVLMNDDTEKFKIVYHKIADCYFRLNEPDSTLLVAYLGLEKYPDHSSLNYWAALVHEKLGHTKCAIPHYEKLVEIDPQKKDYWSKLAILYFQLEDEKALEAQQKVCDLDPADVEASRLLSQMVIHFGGDPLQILRETYKKDTTNIENAYRYGKEAFDAGFYKDATEPFKVILAINNRNTSAMEYLGRSYEALNQISNAIEIYKDILQVEPRNTKIMCMIASVYARQNQFTSARTYVRKAISIDASNGLPYMVMGEVYENAVNYCSNQRSKKELTYDDKLVYQKAVGEYHKAERDPNYAADAKRRANQLRNLVPTKEDYFMQKNRSEPREECYSWMK